MPDEKQSTQVKEATGTMLKTADLAALLPPKTGSLLPDGTAIKIFPSAKDIPMENAQMSKDSIAKPLKITKSKADITSGYAYLKRLQVIKDMPGARPRPAALAREGAEEWSEKCFRRT
jgi:hypothetical protein